ncbi:DUF192 domain-containing protein [Texcoconibacillus texcoconensis]|uniref:DUF192 domain-containing protein n=1 Tax=Texcoconibacillus texcoconensis TaxID=1095777 RepID=A0A840QQ30_9BACI|nr:DUF192 domain-containing protein [Texcoconibacillus texcoconensis]MBB5173475.1 hypothetical protein [Texcoconibacillus texcoconensis]
MVIEKSEISVKTSIQVQVADTFVKRFRGLMLKKEPIQHEGLLLSPCNSIHMFFMHFPIDVVFLDRENTVIKTVESLKPWRVTSRIRGAHACLELPVGTIAKYDIRAGWKISFNDLKRD